MACLLGTFLCAMLMSPPGAAHVPTIAGVQAAFDREAVVADGKHDKDLKITGLECQPNQPSGYFCQVNFVRSAQTSGQVYLDAALVEQSNNGNWKLLKGLCRRLL